MTTPWRAAAALVLALAAGGGAAAQTSGSGAGDDAICTDRPSKLSAPCTAPQGVFQLETDLVNGSFMRQDGVTTDIWYATSPTLKYGLTKSLDVEVNIAPYEYVRTKSAPGPAQVDGGVGDLYLRAKYAVYAPSDGKLSASFFPYVKAPTARDGLGNGGWEGGVLVPIAYKLTDKLTLGLSPELDAYKDQAGDGRHLNHIEVVNLNYNLPHDVAVSAELWGDWNYDPVKEMDQYSADVTIAWVVEKSLQLDAGLNFGLNSETPGVQGYVGVSKRF